MGSHLVTALSFLNRQSGVSDGVVCRLISDGEIFGNCPASEWPALIYQDIRQTHTIDSARKVKLTCPGVSRPFPALSTPLSNAVHGGHRLRLHDLGIVDVRFDRYQKCVSKFLSSQARTVVPSTIQPFEDNIVILVLCGVWKVNDVRVVHRIDSPIPVHCTKRGNHSIL